MKIVIATPFYPPKVGTLATYAAGIESALQRKGHTVKVVPLGSIASFPSGIRHVAYYCKVLVAMRGAWFVIALDTWSVGMPALFASRLMRVPFVIRIGGDFLWEKYVARTGEKVRLSEFYSEIRRCSLFERIIFRWFRHLVRHAHTIFFNSRFQRDIWQKVYALDKRRTKILENFYTEKAAFVAPHNRVFVSAGRATAVKNYVDLQAAFARVKWKFPDIELDTRTVPHAQQAARIQGSYAVIIPSISEANSNIAIESVIAGRPFIISEDTGSKERLSECGLFVDTRSDAALEKAIESLLDPTVYQKLSAQIQAFSFTHSWDEIADEILAAV